MAQFLGDTLKELPQGQLLIVVKNYVRNQKPTNFLYLGELGLSTFQKLHEHAFLIIFVSLSSQ
jgi:hypothetical protein